MSSAACASLRDMKWFRKPTADKAPSNGVTWENVVEAGNRCKADIDLISRTELLGDDEKKALTNDALDVFVDVFASYLRR